MSSISDVILEIGERALAHETFTERGQAPVEDHAVGDALEHIGGLRVLSDSMNRLDEMHVQPHRVTEPFGLATYHLKQYTLALATNLLLVQTTTDWEDRPNHVRMLSTFETHDAHVLAMRVGAYLLTGDAKYNSLVNGQGIPWILKGLYQKNPTLIPGGKSPRTICYARDAFVVAWLDKGASQLYEQTVDSAAIATDRAAEIPYKVTVDLGQRRDRNVVTFSHSGLQIASKQPADFFDRENGQPDFRLVRRCCDLVDGFVVYGGRDGMYDTRRPGQMSATSDRGRGTGIVAAFERLG